MANRKTKIDVRYIVEIWDSTKQCWIEVGTMSTYNIRTAQSIAREFGANYRIRRMTELTTPPQRARRKGTVNVA